MTGTAPNQLAVGPFIALVCAPVGDEPLFPRCPPTHSVLLGRSRVEIGGTEHSTRALAVPANTPHHVVEIFDAYGVVAYLDPRRYTFADAEHLRDAWQDFVPGRDDLQTALKVALDRPPRRIDRRVSQALELIETEDLSVAETAVRVGLSPSRLTHLVSEVVGAPPRVWRAWFRLIRAIQFAIGGANMTQAAHQAGFADSAHLTRTCKQLTGVRPAKMMPDRILPESETTQG